MTVCKFIYYISRSQVCSAFSECWWDVISWLSPREAQNYKNLISFIFPESVFHKICSLSLHKIQVISLYGVSRHPSLLFVPTKTKLILQIQRHSEFSICHIKQQESYSVLCSSTADTHFSKVYISSLNKQCDSNALQCTLDMLVKENLTRPFSACKGQGIDEQKTWVLPAGLEND